MAGNAQDPRLMSFAHLAGLNPRAADPNPDDTDDKGKKAVVDNDPDNDDPPADDKSGKQGKAADKDGDAEDEEDAKDATASAARDRERARCAAIFGDQAAAKNPALAARIAFGTTLPRSAAVQLLRDGVATQPGAPGLRDRMHALEGFRITSSAPTPDKAQQIQSSWDNAASRAGVRRGQ